MTYILHHIPGSRSLRVLWLMEEMGLDYEIRDQSRTLKSEEYKAISPLGVVPALEIDGQILLESGAILQFLLAKHGPSALSPDPASPAFGPYLQWFHFVEATLAPWVVTYMLNVKFKPEPQRNAPAADEARARITDLLNYAGKALSERPYFAGDAFTAADIMVGHGLYVCQLNGLLGDAHPVLDEYVRRITSRPAFGRAASN